MTTTTAQATPTRRVRVRPRRGAAGRASVSVVVPSYNYGHFLPAAVESALEQPGVDVEVIVVDDASTDGSVDVAGSLASRDSRVTVIAQSTNAGPVETFNRGLRAVTGEFLVRLDADDLLTPGSLLRSVRLARAFPTVGLVYGHPLHFHEVRRRAREHVTSWTVWPGRRWLADRCSDGYNVITSPEVLMRTSVVSRVGGQAPLAHTHDMEMWFRIAAFSDVGHIEGADQAWHRDHPSSLSARRVDVLTDLRERRAAFDILFAGAAGALPEAPELHEQALRAIALEAVDRATHEFDRGRNSSELVDALCEIAVATWPSVTGDEAWGALLRRAATDPRSAARRPRAIAAVLRRRLDREIAYWRWTRRGVYREGRSWF
jgi:hypothetical protein